MLKFLLLVALVAVIIWACRKGSAKQPDSRLRVPPAPENMVVCAHCGIRFPSGESSQDVDIHYCCDEHRRAGPR